jgi:hypothetical protein
MVLKNLIHGIVLAATASSVLASGVMAQTVPQRTSNDSIETIPEAFDRAFFNRSGDLYENSSIGRQIEFILNFRGFPDGEIERDAKTTEILYREFFNQQAISDPYLRTPDLANPYNSSLLLNSGIPTPAYTAPVPPPAPVVPEPPPVVEPPIPEVPEIPRGLY